ncbi:MBL fold metallo-hydrolase [Amycolatopsis alkalitolerans]|uniref:MBL fold metallo-hydrolase n=1 Tax=Amycolatopsis alkalitolerans TaxID=2547244 RepID=A0A5C4M1A2_9PSEU|nr:MBL fold metallo-hydrolase [Amycolatopsis alkalitolerans]TNC24326.1 MBL fold metallo-hydrolase [Amycolatopsis alkalitolerans]
MRWIELGEGVFARRYEHLDQTLGLVVGAERCLVVDTGGDEVQGAEFAAAIREITTAPWLVVLTHAHFDHHFGTKPFQPCPVWAHERCGPAMGADRATWVANFRRQHEHERAQRLLEAELVPPTHVLTGEVSLDLGGRKVTLLHPGPGHTDHDVAVDVPDAQVLFAGDLVEQGAPPSIGPDSHVEDWPHALDGLLARDPATVVPGHGEPVDAAFVRRQRDELRRS